MPGVRFPSTEALKRLGIVEPEVFYPSGGELTPTIQVADLSRSVASEPVEGRVYRFVVQAGSIGRLSVFELRCMAPGGLVVERGFLAFPPDSSASGSTADGAQVQVDGNRFVTVPSSSAGLDIGGVATRSEFTTGVLLPGSITGASQRWHNSMAAPIYVRSGETFRIFTNQQNLFLMWWMILRELPDIQP